MITGTIISLYAIFQSFGLDFIKYGPADAHIVSTMGNPNYLGSYLVLIFPISIFLYLERRKNWVLLNIGLVLFAILATMTRSAWLGSVIIAILFIAFFSKKIMTNKQFRLRFIILTLFSLAIILLFFALKGSVFTNRLFSIFTDAQSFVEGQASSDYAGSNRGFIWPRVIELIKQKPWFGYGVENLVYPFNRNYFFEAVKVYGYNAMVDKAHNEYLHIAVNSGIPALIFYLLLLFNAIKKGFTNLRSEPIIQIFLISIIGYLVQAFFNISVTTNAYIFWIFLGLMSKYTEKNSNILFEKDEH